MKKNWLILLLLATLFTFSASCADSASGSNSAKPTENVQNGLDVKSEEEIKSDLNQEGFFAYFDVYCYDDNQNYTGSAYTINDVSISKRKIDSDAKVDDVYVSVSCENNSSKYLGEYHLLYTWYDVGGWCLDEIEFISGEFEPIEFISDSDIIASVLQVLGDLNASENDITIISRNHSNPTDEEVTLELNYNDGILAVWGNIRLYYYFDGTYWRFGDSAWDLNDNILCDGTYESIYDQTLSIYIIISHDNGKLVAWRTEITASYVNELSPLDLTFDITTRTYHYNDFGSHELRITENGEIYMDMVRGHSSTLERLERIADPITDKDELYDFLLRSGRHWERNTTWY